MSGCSAGTGGRREAACRHRTPCVDEAGDERTDIFPKDRAEKRSLLASPQEECTIARALGQHVVARIGRARLTRRTPTGPSYLTRSCAAAAARL
eukprot:scaffold49213_cov54-Phaeocystis_antarctica.AAC.2